MSEWYRTDFVNGAWMAEGTTPSGHYANVWNADCKTKEDAIALLIFTIREELAEERAMEAES